MMLNKGQVIAGRYEIVEKIGMGGMAVVYRAKDKKLDRSVTFKVLRQEHLGNEAFIRRFMVEARAVASLNHPNIVNVYDVGQEEDINYIVMEYIDGVTLKELIDKKAPFDNVETLGVAIQIASALLHAHESGIVHRDIKPQNVLVTPAGTVKVTDFGIARTINAQTDTFNDSTMGSVHYFSPEQARGGHVDNKSDLYSLGIVMFEMVTGTLPFDGEESVAVALMHVNDALPDMKELNPHVSRSVESIIFRLTQKDAEQRYPSADKLLVDLRMAITKPDMAMGILEEEDEPEDEDEETAVNVFPKVTSFSFAKFKVEIAAVATAVVLLIILLAVLIPHLRKPEVTYAVIPELVGLTYEAAAERADNAKLNVEMLQERHDEDNEAGIVIWQNYTVGESLMPGDTIGVIISLGTQKVRMPALTGIELREAEKKLEGYSFGLAVEYGFNADVPYGVVISQTPEENELAMPGTIVTIVVSKGEEMTKVIAPELYGLTEADAKEKLENLGLVLGNVSTNYNTRYPKDQVCLQTVAGGKDVLKGTSVGIVISLGPAPATPTPEPTEAPVNPPDGNDDDTPAMGGEKELALSFAPNIPEGIGTFELSIMKKTSENFVEVYRQEHTVYDLPVIVNIRGAGLVELHMMVNGVDVGSEFVDFDNVAGGQ